MTEEQDQASEYKCAPENHEDWKLIYRHQGDGFNFFYCLHCNWTKPDLASPVFKQLLEEKDARIRELENVLECDAAGRPIPELLRIAAENTDALGGGAVSDCLHILADSIEALSPKEKENGLR